MAESDKFSPATEQALSATLDVSRHAIAEARRNMRALAEARDSAEKRNEQLKKDLKQAEEKLEHSLTLERRLEIAADTSAGLQRALDAERAKAEDLRKQLAASAASVDALEKQLRQSQERIRALDQQVTGAASQGALLQQALDAEKARAHDLRKRLAAAGDAVHAFGKQLSEAQGRSFGLGGQLRKASQERRTLEDELSNSRESISGLKEERHELQRELAAACNEIAEQDDQLASDGQLSDALQIDVCLLRRTLEQIDKRLEDQAGNPVLTSTNRERRVVWIGCRNCSGCTLLTTSDRKKLVPSSPDQAVEMLSEHGADALITDMSITGIDWLSDVRKRYPDLIIIVTTGCGDGQADTEATVSSIATTVIPQPCEHAEIASAVESAFFWRALSSGTDALVADHTPGRPRLLIADDDERTRTRLLTALEQRGYDIVCVEDGAAAIEAVKSSDFNVVVAKIRMPRLNAIGMMVAMKVLKPKISVIVLSAAEDPALSLEALRAGAFCHVAESASMEELSLAITRAMRVDRLERDLHELNALLERRTLELEKALHALQEAANLVASSRRSQKRPSAGMIR